MADSREEKKNRYYNARREAAKRDPNLWRCECAAEKVGLSGSQLSNYEREVTKRIPAGAVVMMAELYGAPELAYLYCAHDCEIGKTMPVPTSVSKIELITLKVIKALSREAVNDLNTKLLEISTDGMLTKENKPTVNWLVSHLDNLTETLLELRLSLQKMSCDSDGKK